MPRLAGQQPEYLANQLQAFIDRRRTNPVMFNVAHVLDPAMVKALSSYFKDLNPKPLGGASKALVPEGKKIYRRRHTERQYSSLRFLSSGRTPRAPMHFRGLRVSFMTTSTGS